MKHSCNKVAKKSLSVKEAFSLVEVLIATAVFAVVALGLAKTVFQSRKMAESSIYMTTAHGVAYGYVEQLMAMEFDELMESHLDAENPVVMKAISPSTSSTGTVEIDDNLTLDKWTNKDIVIDIRDDGEAERSIVMPMRFRLALNYINSGTDPREAFEVTLRYRYKSPARRDDEWVQSDLRFVKSAIPVY